MRRFNEIGDYSYGIYIYAFPAQQAIVLLFPGWSIAESTLACMVVTLVLSALSWHLIEKRALDVKGQFSRWLQAALPSRNLIR